MKKLIMVAAIVCATVMSQAATIKWTTSGNVYGIDSATVNGNGSVALSTSTLLKATGNTYTYLVTFYEAGKDTAVASFDGTSLFSSTAKKISKTFTDDTNLKASTDYDYKIVITSNVKDLQDRGVDGDWDYSAAYITTELTGSLTTEPSGTTSLSADVTGWTVAGATPVESVPEPTSGLLLVIGMAGLALRRRRA